MANFKEDAEIAFQKSIEEIEKRVLQKFGTESKLTPYEIDIMRFAFLNGVAWATERSNENFSTIEK